MGHFSHIKNLSRRKKLKDYNIIVLTTGFYSFTTN